MYFRADTFISSPENYQFRLYLQLKDRDNSGWVRLKESVVLKELGISVTSLQRRLKGCHGLNFILQHERDNNWLYVKYTSLHKIGGTGTGDYLGSCTKEEILDKNLLKAKAYEIIALGQQRITREKFTKLNRKKGLNLEIYSINEARREFNSA